MYQQHDKGAKEMKKSKNASQLTDLHVFIVPLDLWLDRYRTAYNNAVLESTSAGFIRITASTSLHSVREAIYEQLGNEIVPSDFIYLRSVGRCLAVVNKNQEHNLQGKDFAPPLAYSPELFLLPCTHEEALSGTKRLYDTEEYYSKNLYSGPFTYDSNDSNDSTTFFSPRDSVINSDISPKFDFAKSSKPAVKQVNETTTNSQPAVENIQDEKSPPLSDGNDKNDLVPELDIDESDVYTNDDMNVHDSERSSALPATSSVFKLIKPELALIPATPEQHFPLPSARVVTKSHSRLQESIANASSLGVTFEEPAKLSKHESRENKILRHRNIQNNDKKKIIRERMKEKQLETEYESDNEEGDNEEADQTELSPERNVRLLSLEAKMKERYEREKQRLEEEKNAQSTRSDENNNIKGGRDTQLMYEDDEFTTKLKQIEELKKKNTETRKKQQMEEEEKQKKHLEDLEEKKMKVQELKRQLENTRSEKHNFQKQREALVKRSRSLQAEINSKISQKNNTWRKKFVEEKKQTTILEEELKRTKNQVEGQHRKLVSSFGIYGIAGKSKDLMMNGGVPSERNNQKNMILRLQSENEDLKSRIDLLNKKLIAESKMKGVAIQELKDIRDKAIEFKINASRAKKALPQ